MTEPRWKPTKPCSIEGCGGLAEGHGLCGKHYQRWKHHGDPYFTALRRVEEPDWHTCTVDGCERVSPGLLCPMHLARRNRHGASDVTKQNTGDPWYRFWTQVDFFGPEVPDHPEMGLCHLWTGTVMVQGYGHLSVGGRAGGLVRVHRWLWTETRGPIPPLANGRPAPLDHQCHNYDLRCAGGPLCLHRRCVNLDHLRVTSHRENIRAARVRERRALVRRAGGSDRQPQL